MSTIVTESASSQPTSHESSHSRVFDSLASSKKLGCIVEKRRTTFHVFAPRATGVQLVLFQKYDQEKGEEFTMKRDRNGVWSHVIPKNLTGRFYGYRVSGPAGKGEMFDNRVVIGDPYSKAVVTKNNYHHPAKTLILDTSYDWEGDTYVIPPDHNKLIIYEAHVRDLTAHPSSGISARGTYLGLTKQGQTGGMSYLKDLGINAIELLPMQKFGNIEIPFADSATRTEEGEYNTWNPYGRNHWGYMTSYYFAPETYYATGGTMEPDKYNGGDGRAVREFKDMVKAFHREGIAVILDVVFNHASQYDYNPFKYIDKFYYFHIDSSGRFIKTSGCGNDFRTDRPMSRRMIVDCIKYWMTEYHIDGFRFDIATMIDRETCKEIAAEARIINPAVALIAEPWGGGKWDPPGFSDIGWAAWNDWFRNGVKGQNPRTDLGFIFGKFQGKNTRKSLMSALTGTLREDGGMFLKKEHSINYLESHDNYTLGDFVRIGLGDARENQVITDVDSFVRLTPQQLALHKLAALFLLASQGPVMIHEGQEFARSKVISPTPSPDPKVGMLDHNSYEKDNATNYLNYAHRGINRELYDYYKGLIELRRHHSVFGSAPKRTLKFLETKDEFLIAFRLGPDKSLKEQKSFIVILNGNPKQPFDFALPDGRWTIVANAKGVALDGRLGTASGKTVIPATSGAILMEE